MPRLQLILLVVIVILGGVFGGVLYHNKQQPLAIEICPTDVMACPDGSTVPRMDTTCEFAVCAQERPKYMEPIAQGQGSTTPITTSEVKPSLSPQTSAGKLFEKVRAPLVSVFEKIGAAISPAINPAPTTLTTNQQVYINSQGSSPTSPSNSTFNETRYTIQNGSIVDGNNSIIYTFPPSTSQSGWSTHIVDVVAVNQIIPIINTIPIVGQPGQFYVSENSHGNLANCEFSNRVYILDTLTGKKVLMYEENNASIAGDIARSCTSELYLLATENEKLILKSHTVGTGSTCESTWSEPEQTWYLDVTKLEKGLRRYIISAALYYKAEAEESACRTKYEATSTDQQTIGG